MKPYFPIRLLSALLGSWGLVSCQTPGPVPADSGRPECATAGPVKRLRTLRQQQMFQRVRFRH